MACREPVAFVDYVRGVRNASLCVSVAESLSDFACSEAIWSPSTGNVCADSVSVVNGVYGEIGQCLSETVHSLQEDCMEAQERADNETFDVAHNAFSAVLCVDEELASDALLGDTVFVFTRRFMGVDVVLLGDNGDEVDFDGGIYPEMKMYVLVLFDAAAPVYEGSAVLEWDDGVQRIELYFVQDACASRLDSERIVNCSYPISIPFAMDLNVRACGVLKRRRSCRECVCFASPKGADAVASEQLIHVSRMIPSCNHTVTSAAILPRWASTAWLS